MINEMFYREINVQAQYAIHALNDSKFHYDEKIKTNYMDHHQQIFRNLHSFLTHAANISKIFWTPSDKKASKERSSKLREDFGLPESRNDHILGDRRLRDDLDHFDERLDSWSTGTGKNQIIIDGLGKASDYRTFSRQSIYRLFDPSSGTMFFRENDYDLKSLAEAVVDIRDQSNLILINLY